jgi:hypothetical protein
MKKKMQKKNEVWIIIIIIIIKSEPAADLTKRIVVGNKGEVA